MEDIYQENILDHNAHPRNKRVISGAHVSANMFDDKNNVTDVAFQGEGCAVSQAGLSMLTESLKGKTERELKLLSPGDIYTMLGVQISPGRVNCALLGYEALQKILKESR
jgi:nitrogen fixation NifU-like protein